MKIVRDLKGLDKVRHNELAFMCASSKWRWSRPKRSSIDSRDMYTLNSYANARKDPRRQYIHGAIHCPASNVHRINTRTWRQLVGPDFRCGERSQSRLTVDGDPKEPNSYTNDLIIPHLLHQRISSPVCIMPTDEKVPQYSTSSTNSECI